HNQSALCSLFVVVVFFVFAVRKAVGPVSGVTGNAAGEPRCDSSHGMHPTMNALTALRDHESH
ncbi:MAG TPA: hypothetical protein VGD94_23565, partial [Vicinamibacterales bacterium]